MRGWEKELGSKINCFSCYFIPFREEIYETEGRGYFWKPLMFRLVGKLHLFQKKVYISEVLHSMHVCVASFRSVYFLCPTCSMFCATWHIYWLLFHSSMSIFHWIDQMCRAHSCTPLQAKRAHEAVPQPTDYLARLLAHAQWNLTHVSSEISPTELIERHLLARLYSLRLQSQTYFLGNESHWIWSYFWLLLAQSTLHA